MDKIQSKLVELVDNLPALDICLQNERLGYPDIVLFLQYDISLESSCAAYGSLKRTFHSLKYNNQYPTDERNEEVIRIMRRVQEYIVKIDINGSQARTVYKEATDIAEEICNRLQNDGGCTIIHPTVPSYIEKAAI